VAYSKGFFSMFLLQSAFYRAVRRKTEIERTV
jgi:hypothetical protein